MDDPRLDHWAVSVQLVDSRINPMPALEDLRRPVRLKMSNWPTRRDQWKSALESCLQQLGSRPAEGNIFTYLDSMKWLMLTTAGQILGTTGGKIRAIIPFNTPKYICLCNRLRFLQAACRDIATRLTQPSLPASRAMRKAWDARIFPLNSTPQVSIHSLSMSNLQDWIRILREQIEVTKNLIQQHRLIQQHGLMRSIIFLIQMA